MLLRHLKVCACNTSYSVLVYIDYFADQEMDGAALVQAFASCSGPDCLKSVISKFGIRVKVYTAIKSRLEAEVKRAVRSHIPYHG